MRKASGASLISNAEGFFLKKTIQVILIDAKLNGSYFYLFLKYKVIINNDNKMIFSNFLIDMGLQDVFKNIKWQNKEDGTYGIRGFLSCIKKF